MTQSSAPVATQTFQVFGADQYNFGGWDQEFGSSVSNVIVNGVNRLNGLTGSSGQVDYLAFTASSGSLYWFSASLNNGTTMSIVDSTGAAVTLTSDSNATQQTFTAQTTGTYFVKMSYGGPPLSYSVTGGDTLVLPPDPNAAATQDSFYSILAGGNRYWRNLSSTAAVAPTNDGIGNARHSLTYSFATSDPAHDPLGGFAAMGPNEQSAVRAALAYISSQFDITFTEVAAGTGDIVYGTDHQPSMDDRGFAYSPSATGTNVYLNNDSQFGYGESTNYSPGSEAWDELLYLTGQSLGLKSASYYATYGTIPTGPYLSSTTDLRTYTQMSHNTATNLFYDYNVSGTSSAYSYTSVSLNPSTYQLYDYEALQYLYGAKTGVHLGDVSFAVSPAMLKTIYADTGLNIIDVSNQTLSSDINLNADHFSSIAKRTTSADKRLSLTIPSFANGLGDPSYDGVNNLAIAAGSKFDEVKLGAGAADTVTCNDDGDTIVCGTGSATVTGGSGNDTIQIAANSGSIAFDGKAGVNAASIAGAFAAYTVIYYQPTNTITATNLTTGKVDTLTNVASVQFSDRNYTAVATAPTVMVTKSSVPTFYGVSVQASSLFTATDPSGLIDQYQLIDGSTALNAGHFRVNGVDQAVGATVLVSASDLASTVFVASTVSRTESLSVQAIDSANGTSSAVKTLSVVTSKPTPTVTVANSLVNATYHQKISVSSLFTATDTGGSITGYRLQDSSVNGTGHFQVNGTDYLSPQVIDIAASDLATAYFIAGDGGAAGTDAVSVIASDLYSVAPAKTVSVSVTLTPPTTSALASSISASHLQSFGFSDLFAAIEPASQAFAVTRYDFYDTTPGNGTIFVNGVAQASGTDIVVDATALNTLRFVASGTDMLAARVNDGRNWSNYAHVTIGGPVDRAPVVTAVPASALGTPLRPGDSAAASTLFTVSDADGDPATKYMFYDAGTNGSILTIGGTNATGGNGTIIAASDLGSVSFTAGKGTDILYVKAYDGLDWSAWGAVSVTGGYVPPVVGAQRSALNATHQQSFAFSDLFTVTDPQGSAITRYDFYEASNGGVAINVNGVPQTLGTDVIVNASDLSLARFVVWGSGTLYARAYDGHGWSSYKPVTISAPADVAPVVVAQTGLSTPRPGETIHAYSLFSASDPDQYDTVTRYIFYDAGKGGSRLTVGSALQSAGSVLNISAASMSAVGIVAGTGPDDIYIKAYDGFAWGSWTKVTVAGANLAPVVSALSTAVSATHFQRYGFSDLFTAYDPQGSAIVKYDFYDYDLSGTGNHGAVQLNGVTQAANTDVVVAASALSSLSFLASGSDALYARVYDGFTWGAYKKITITAPNDAAPVISVLNSASTPRPGGTLDASSLFTATDPDADSIAKYVFYDDGAAGGRLKLNGVLQAAGAVVTVAASDLGTVSVVAGTGTDTLYVKAGDGLVLSGWKAISVTGRNIQAVVSAITATVSPTAGTVFHFGDLFTLTDQQGAGAATRYEFYDATAAGGKTYIGTALQSAGTDVIVTGANLSSLSYVANGSDTLYARFYDGFTWSAFAHVNLTAPAASPPPVLASPVNVASLLSADANKYGSGFAAAS